MRQRPHRRWLLLALAAYAVLVPLASVAVGAMADMEQPFSDTGTVIWSVIVPAVTVFLIAFGAWLALRGAHAGIVLSIVGGLMLLYFIGALPEIAQDAGLEWPF
jgi:hypothetical protein